MWVLLLFVVSVLSTAISQGVHANQLANAPWTVVCTSATTGLSPGQPGDIAHDGIQHCAICLAHAHLAGLAPSPAPQGPWSAADANVPPSHVALHATRSRAWPDAPARAPPARA